MCAAEIELKLSLHICDYTVSLWSVSLIFQRVTVIGWDGLGAPEEKTEHANGGTMLLGLKYSSQPVHIQLFFSSFQQTQPEMNYIKLFVANRKGLGWSVGFWERERAMELNIKTAACLCCVCPLSLSRLLLSSVLDYGSPLVYVITKTFNWVWQLRPALDTLNIFEYVFLTSAEVVELCFCYQHSFLHPLLVLCFLCVY